MTQEQATELREFLVRELNTNGYSDIVLEVTTRLEESYDEEHFERNPFYLLRFFLSESIQVLDSLSNNNFDRLITRFNKVINGNVRIEGISVELLNQGEQVYYDLRALPTYGEISATFQEILNEISNYN